METRINKKSKDFIDITIDPATYDAIIFVIYVPKAESFLDGRDLLLNLYPSSSIMDIITANRYAGSTNGRIKMFNHPERLPISKKALASIKMAANPMITVKASIICQSGKVDW